MAQSLKSSVVRQARTKKQSRLKAVLGSARMVSTLPTTSIKGRPRSEHWQASTWEFFDCVGEFRAACSWVGNLLSKATLHITYDGKPLDPEQDTSRATEYLASLYGGPEGQGEMLRQMGIHFTAAGECWLIGETKFADGKEADRWGVFTPSELQRQTDRKWTTTEDVFDDPFVVRLWRPHPARPHLSDSPARAVLPVLAEIDGLTKHKAATIDSRLSSAGILILPDTIEFSSPPQQRTSEEGDPPEDEHTQVSQDATGLAEELGRIAALSLTNRGAAEANVPIILQVSEEAVDKVKFVDFWSSFDEKMDELMESAVHRLALGMDMPPETVEGSGDSNHWTAWQIEDSAIKIHSQPLLAVITTALTTGYLQSLLLDDEMEWAEVRRYGIGADTKDMSLKPNRSKEAVELWQSRALKTARMLEENGFDPDDEMDEKERATWLAIDVAGGSTTPELVEAALRHIGVNLPRVAAPEGEEGSEARPKPTLEDHPVRELPDTQDRDVEIAAHLLTLRALERAGNRLKTRMGGPKMAGVLAAELYLQVPVNTTDLEYLLEDAWPWAPEIAATLGLEPEPFVDALDSYVRALLMQQAKPDVAMMMRYIRPDATKAA